ncbi:(p)ppGpp synthetase [Oceanispirochaeta crateris]|uniref:(P)ppGpp synthetase n=1 Tax=Oceanispirochaeta crateris TaxID=2518645 RepID=A0A5C1QN45_9SPIO|nr:(p)ppGpp synthetase [Oceanispirochaeta crateris]QEN08957.1 (p)ppGpp synthetase [Oceanispirochaeta crateris]
MDEATFHIEAKEKLETRYNEALPAFSATLNILNDMIYAGAHEKGLSVTVRHRVKEFSSWHAKFLRNISLGKDKKPLAITDILGIRIICPFLEEIEAISNMLQELFQITEYEVKGAEYPYQYFGYESVHFLIVLPEDTYSSDSPILDFLNPLVCEIQVRTILQEAWAEVEHELVYKSEFSPLDEPLKRKLAALNANLTLSDIMFQEIRAYQRELNSALNQRRKDFYDCISQNPQKDRESESRAPEKNQPPSIIQETIDTLLLRGLLAHNENHYSEAIEIYSTILLRKINNDIRAVILVHRGMAYFSSNLQDAALEDFNQAIELNPGQTKARYYRAVHARVNGNLSDALSDIEECIKAEPYNIEFITARAETLAAAGKLQSAIEDCRIVLKLAPDFKPALKLLHSLETS